jgi:hypothetical protein
MGQRTNRFQRFIFAVEQQLAPSGASVEQSALVADTVDGTLREVDIVIRCPAGQRTLTIGIECRDHERKADVTWVEQVKSKFDLLPLDRHVIVSRRGFSDGARARAALWNIEAITLEAAEHIDWASKLYGWKELSFVRIRSRLIASFLKCADGVDQGGYIPRSAYLPISFGDGRRETVYELGNSLLLTRSLQQQLVVFEKDPSGGWTSFCFAVVFKKGQGFVADHSGVIREVISIEYVGETRMTKSPQVEISSSTYSGVRVGLGTGHVDGVDFSVILSDAGQQVRGTTELRGEIEGTMDMAQEWTDDVDYTQWMDIHPLEKTGSQ